MDKFVYVDGKKYKRGYTTGSCAAAATKASFITLLTEKKVSNVTIDTPKEISLNIPVINQKISGYYVISSVIKDGGDDIDATHNMEICSKVEIIDIKNIPDKKCEKKLDYVDITSGIGIGVVTKKGLSTPVGRPAINPVPIKMILKEIENVIEEFDVDIKSFLGKKSILVTIFAPEGENIAKKTFNEHLGILGGISIIGTSGIVEPMSDDGWKKALSAELSIKREEVDEIVLVPGNIGLDTMINRYGISSNKIVKMSNFVGYMLMECKRMEFKKIIVGGHIGKLIKLSAGIMNTHSRVADARNEIMIANLALLGASYDIIKNIEDCITTDAMIPIIKNNGYEKIFEVLAEKSVNRAKRYIRDDKIDIEVWLFSMEGELLAKR